MRAAGPCWRAVNAFGVRDAWAGKTDMTSRTEAEARAPADGMTLTHRSEEDGVGPAFSGPKHWHFFECVAERAAR